MGAAYSMDFSNRSVLPELEIHYKEINIFHFEKDLTTGPFLYTFCLKI